MEEIDKKLTEILEYLNNEKLCELQSEIKFAQYAWENYQYIMNSESERIATITNLQRVKNVAYKDMLFFTQRLESKLEEPSIKKEREVMELSEEYCKIQKNYQYSVELYCVSTIMEVLYAQNFEKLFLENIGKDMSLILQEGKEFLCRKQGEMSKIIKDCKKIKDKEQIIENSSSVNGKKAFLLKKVMEDSILDKESYLEVIDQIQENYNKPCEIAWCDNQLYKGEISHC